MSRSLTELLKSLSTLNLHLRQGLEAAELNIPEANRLLQQLATIGLGVNHGTLGDIVLQSAYGPGGPSDSGRVFQAALVLPHGIGVVIWDSEELYGLRSYPDLELQQAVLHFSRFEDCSPALQALVLPYAAGLIERFLRATGLANLQDRVDDR